MALAYWLKRVCAGVLLLVVFVVGARFASVNTELVRLDFLAGSATVSLAAAMLLAFVSGMLVGYVGSLATAWRGYRAARRARQEQRKLQREVNSLRTLPVRDAG